jgi:protein dithiol oxidoreductase (disulfide-forming)
MQKILLVLSGLFLAFNVAAAPVFQGVDYVIATNASSTIVKKKKINVKEFFSFTCIHCKDIEPLIEANILPNKNVDLERIQVPWNASTTNLAKINATYQMMGLNRLYTPTFNAVFTGQDLSKPQELTKFLQQNKVDVAKFMALYNSFTINSTVGRYKDLMKSYNIEGTPTFIVADKYILKPATPARAVEVLQYLINQKR